MSSSFLKNSTSFPMVSFSACIFGWLAVLLVSQRILWFWEVFSWPMSNHVMTWILFGFGISYFGIICNKLTTLLFNIFSIILEQSSNEWSPKLHILQNCKSILSLRGKLNVVCPSCQHVKQYNLPLSQPWPRPRSLYILCQPLYPPRPPWICGSLNCSEA